jgi:cation:H+ antiporter
MFDVLIYVLSFVAIWVGAGITIGSVEKLSKSLKISSFAVSFLVLGFFTSVSEMSVGVNSVLRNDPEIYVGNLIGASIVIFLMIVPLLAIVGNRLKIQPQLRGFSLVYALIVIAAPVLLAFDGSVSLFDSVVCIGLFVVLAFRTQTKKGLLERTPNFYGHSKNVWGKELLKIVAGVALIFLASNMVVQKTELFSRELGMTPFLLSLLLISIGTNLPELSIVVRSAFMKNMDVAFGDYVGSAAFNTFLLGALTLWYGKPVALTNSYVVSLGFLLVGLSSFYWFARTGNTVSRVEGLVLLSFYIVFLMVELLIH